MMQARAVRVEGSRLAGIMANSRSRWNAQVSVGLYPQNSEETPLCRLEAPLVSWGISESVEGGVAINMAMKRARKAAHRKQVVAQKRRAEQLNASLPARVLRAAQMPIQQCFLTESLFESGIGTLLLARGASSLNIALGSFLLDVFCLGIKDVMFRAVDEEAFELYMAAMNATAPAISVDPSYGRKLLRDLAAWSQSIGFPPHR